MISVIRNTLILLATLNTFFVERSFAVQDSPQSFTFQGRLFNAAGTDPLEEPVTLKFQIYNPSASCLLYQETQTVDLTNTQGVFSVSIGSATGAGKRTAGVDPGFTMTRVFKNDTATQTRATHATCAGGYTPTAGDTRLLRVTVTPQSGIPEVLSPDQVINSVPHAIVAETLQGLGPTDFIQKDPIYVTDANIKKLFGSLVDGVVDASDLHTHDDLYVKISDTNAQEFGTGGFNNAGKASVGSTSHFGTTTMSVKSDADANVGLAIRANSGSQSADLFQVQNSAGTKLAGISATGGLSATSSTITSTAGNQLVVKYDVTNTQTLDVSSSGASTFTAAGTAPKFGFMGGNVGIGTNSPSSGYKLDVAGAAMFGDPNASSAQIFVKGGQSGNPMLTLSRTVGATIQYSWALAGGGLSFSDDTNGFVTANLFGNSSINQLYIGQKFKIVSDTRESLVSATSFSSIAGSDVSANNLNLQGGLGTGTGTPGDVVIATGNTTTSGASQTSSARMTVKGSTGNVGIGVTSPNTTLQVSAPTNNGVVIGTTTYPTWMGTNGLYVDGSFRAANYLLNSSGSINWGASQARIAGVNANTGTDAYLSFFTGGIATNGERMRIIDNGNIGVGTTVPTEKFHVSGAGTQRIRVSTTNANDAVLQLVTPTKLWEIDVDGNNSFGSTNALHFLEEGVSRLSILTGGRVGIGTATPGQTLSVAGDASITTSSADLLTMGRTSFNSWVFRNTHGGLGVDNGSLIIKPSSSSGVTSDFVVKTTTADSGTPEFVIKSSGKVGIGVVAPAELLEVNGNVKATSFITPSDRKLKKEITRVKGLETVLKLNGVSWKWISDSTSDAGVIAQDLELIYPLAVMTNKQSKLKSVKYNSLIAPLIESTKDLNQMILQDRKKIEELTEANKKLSLENEKMKRDLASIKKKLGL